MLNHIHMKFLLITKNSNVFEKRFVDTLPKHQPYPFILWKEHNLHSNPSILYCKTNLQCFVNTSMKISRRSSFDIQNFKLVPLSSLSKRRKLFVNVCQLSWTELTHHQELGHFAPNLKVVGPTSSCQGVHQDWYTWSIQLGAHLRRWWMEDNVQKSLWPFWICCDAIWPY
jgi:hypothetical protein